MSSKLPSPSSYAQRWSRWGPPDPVAEATGVSFDRPPAGEIKAPTGTIRVCAYHVDWDEAPFCSLDVGTVAEAAHIADNLEVATGGWNVDFVVCYDDQGAMVGSTCPWGFMDFVGL